MNNLYRWKTKLPDIIYRIAQFLEIVISIIVALAIILSFYSIFVELNLMVNDPTVGLHEFLGTAFNVVIGIEFLKMLCRHSVGSVVEVLLFALARGLVVDHGTPIANLITVSTITLLFVVRKFLFIPGLDDKHRQEEEHSLELSPEQYNPKEPAVTIKH